MKAQILKLAKCKTEAEFYKKYPSEEAFMKVHGKTFKKAQMGASMENAGPVNTNQAPIDMPQGLPTNDLTDKRPTQFFTQFSNTYGLPRDFQAANQQKPNPASVSPNRKGASDFLQSLNNTAKKGTKIKKAEDGVRSVDPILNNQLMSPRGGQSVASVIDPTPVTSAEKPLDLMKSTPASTGGYNIASAANAAGDIVGGIQGLFNESDSKRSADQQNRLLKLQTQSLASTDVNALNNRKYVRDTLVQSPFSQGTGTNILQGANGLALTNKVEGNPTEIGNMYNYPLTAYSDQGYAPFEESDKVKAYYNGGKMQVAFGGIQLPTDASNTASNAIGSVFENNAGSKLGKGIGEATGIPGADLAGQLIGGAADQIFGDAGKISRLNKQIAQQQGAMNATMGIRGLAQTHNVNMEDGGSVSPYEWVSHTWQPQVITQFGEHKMSDLLRHDKSMDTLRSGGSLKEDYINPSERALQTYEKGGQFQTHWGGHLEPNSYNPYTAGDGITYIPKGHSHEEADSKGRTGIGLSYDGGAEAPYEQFAEYGTTAATKHANAEIQRNEPTFVDDEGQAQVLGARKINDIYAGLIGDPNSKGRTFQSYGRKLSDRENLLNKQLQKGIELANNAKSKLDTSTAQAIVDGVNKSLENIAKYKETAADVQYVANHITDTHNLDTDAFDKGVIKPLKGKKGITIKAVDGITSTPKYMMKDLPAYNNPSDEYIKKIGQPEFLNNILEHAIGNDNIRPYVSPDSNYVAPTEVKSKPLQYGQHDDTPVKADKPNPWLTALGSVMPYFRPGYNMLRPDLSAEYLAQSMNQQEPVAGFQKYQPQMIMPYNVSLNDQMASIDSQARAAIRAAGANPAAQAAIMAQANEQKNKIGGEQFRMNQAQQMGAYNQNINTMNDAQLKNLAMTQQLAEKQSLAKSATKRDTMAIANSISNKMAEYQKEKMMAKLEEQRYNYRFDPATGMPINYNAPYQFNIPTVGAQQYANAGQYSPQHPARDPQGRPMVPIYDKHGNTTGFKEMAKNGAKIKATNGMIVQSLKRI